MRIHMRFLSVLLLLAGFSARSEAQSLRVRLDGTQLRIAARDFHFITGEALKQLRNGASVNYVFLAKISAEKNGNVLTESEYRFAISYDLWEEKYAVSRLDPLPRSVSHLTASGVEEWCLESIAFPVEKLPAAQPFWVAVEYRIVESQASQSSSADSEFTLSGLIEIFSRKTQRKDSGGRRDGGPFRVADLRSASARNPERR